MLSLLVGTPGMLRQNWAGHSLQEWQDLLEEADRSNRLASRTRSAQSLRAARPRRLSPIEREAKLRAMPHNLHLVQAVARRDRYRQWIGRVPARLPLACLPSF